MVETTTEAPAEVKPEAAPAEAAPAVETPEAKPAEVKPSVTSLLGDKPEEKPAEGEKPAEEKPAEEKPAEEKPIEYSAFTLPEEVTLDEERLTEFKDFASQNKLSQEAAQNLVDMHIAAMEKVATAPQELWIATQKEWQQQVEKDPEIGGAKLPEVKARIGKMLDQYGTPALREALVYTGAGNNPEIIRFVNKLAEKLIEGPIVTGTPPYAGPKTAAEALYPNLPSGART